MVEESRITTGFMILGVWLGYTFGIYGHWFQLIVLTLLGILSQVAYEIRNKIKTEVSE